MPDNNTADAPEILTPKMTAFMDVLLPPAPATPAPSTPSLSIFEENAREEAIVPSRRKVPIGRRWHRKGLCWCGEEHAQGQSGNPKGRKPLKPLTDVLDIIMDEPVDDDLLVGRLKRFKGSGITYAEVIVLQQANIAAFPGKKNKQVSVAAAQNIWDRLEGKVELRVKGNVTHTHMDLTDDERRQRLLQLTQKASGQIIDAEFEDVANQEE